MKRIAVDVIRDYAVYLHKPFSYRTLMTDLGLARRTTLKALSVLKASCEIVEIGKPGEGIYRYATPKQKAAAIKARRAKGAQDMREHGDEYHKILVNL